MKGAYKRGGMGIYIRTHRDRKKASNWRSTVSFD